MQPTRARDLGIVIGDLPTGPHNAITDVPGVRVGHRTLIHDEPRVARTGITVVVPRENSMIEDAAFAGFFSFNGNGEMTGLAWLEESGILSSPIAITNTHQVGLVRDALVEYAIVHHGGRGWFLPVAAETYDGWLNDIAAFHIRREHLFEAVESATSGPVAEGNVGGGTGMICHEFKGGIGTSSRWVDCAGDRYTVGALVQANYGEREQLRVNGVAVGRQISGEVVPLPGSPLPGSGSIIVVIATDAPLLPVQCKRLARRATVGLARVGGTGHNGSGDLFIAFATGNHVPVGSREPVPVRMVPHATMDSLIDAVADTVDESILNALVAAETMTGFQGRVVYGIPHDVLQQMSAGTGRRGMRG